VIPYDRIKSQYYEISFIGHDNPLSEAERCLFCGTCRECHICVVALPMRIKLRTTNVIERAFREVKRRILTMSCFNNNKTLRGSYMRYSGHLNDQWGRKPLKEFTQKN